MNDDGYTRITLRIPKDLHQRIASAADEMSRSTNAEVVARLQASFDYESGTGKSLAELLARMAAIEELIREERGK